MTRHFILDTMMKAQAEVIGEYECWSCGLDKPETELEDRLIHDCCDTDCVLVCLDCIERGWDSWGDPKT